MLHRPLKFATALVTPVNNYECLVLVFWVVVVAVYALGEGRKALNPELLNSGRKPSFRFQYLV
jgi:hypothetical protein